MTLIDAQWAIFAPMIRPRARRAATAGPRSDPKPILHVIHGILDTGAKWESPAFAAGTWALRATCHEWLQKWSADGIWTRVAEAVAAMTFSAGK